MLNEGCRVWRELVTRQTTKKKNMVNEHHHHQQLSFYYFSELWLSSQVFCFLFILRFFFLLWLLSFQILFLKLRALGLWAWLGYYRSDIICSMDFLVCTINTSNSFISAGKTSVEGKPLRLLRQTSVPLRGKKLNTSLLGSRDVCSYIWVPFHYSSSEVQNTLSSEEIWEQ